MYSDYQNEKALLKEYAGKPSQTKDGVKVELVCNIGKPADANKAVECDGEGIGLFRTEFLFMIIAVHLFELFNCFIIRI